MQEKQRAKVKEKIDKCVKEKLMDFCDVLNIPIIKSTSKKVSYDRMILVIVSTIYQLAIILLAYLWFQEDLSAKLLEFLESPHATTDILLAEDQVCITSLFCVYIKH